MRLDEKASRRLLTVGTMRLIARLPQLRSFDVVVPTEADGEALLQPLTAAPALADLAIRWSQVEIASAALSGAIGGCAGSGLRGLSLRSVTFPSGAFLALCSTPNMRRLRHLELGHCFAAAVWFGDVEPPGAVDSKAAFSALEQLRSLTLEKVYGINTLLPHLHLVPALRTLSIRCQPNDYDIDSSFSPLPSRAELSALLAAVPQIEVRLIMPAALDGWLALGQSIEAGRALIEQQWRELQSMGAELERVTVVDVLE